MLTEGLKREVMEKFNMIYDVPFEERYKLKNKRKLQFLGNGIDREVYSLNKYFVIKIQRIHTYYDERNGLIKRQKAKLLQEFKQGIMKDELFLHFVKTMKYEINTESIEKYLGSIFVMDQNYNEVASWETIKYLKLSEYFAQVMGIMLYKGYSIVVQEKGTRVKKGCKSLTEFKKGICREFLDTIFNLNDIHYENFILTDEGDYKICDLGFCRFHKDLIVGE